jgi:hypothetical protein
LISIAAHSKLCWGPLGQTELLFLMWINNCSTSNKKGRASPSFFTIAQPCA